MVRAHERRRAGLLLELAVEDELGVLLDAKDAHAEQGSEESRAAKRAAMESLAETRRWLRALEAIRKADLALAELDGRSDREAVEAREALQERLAELHAKHGPLIEAMAELGAGMPQSPATELPPGSVNVQPSTARAQTNVGEGI
ncbi:hypothetical protein ACIBG7_15260 [Nonomuraea sp. NPDC050328]|uniref:hypothetical protein n=1 Tax=Nonomuraea sp. NPDC050328 TaxID=3364361 RepID=UPI0037B6CF5A